MMNLLWYTVRFALLSLYLAIVSFKPIEGAEAPNQWYAYLLKVPGLSHVRIMTNIKLEGEENKRLNALPLPAEKLDMNKDHYVFVPGRGDHAGKLMNFFYKFIQQAGSTYIWCIDPYGQGGSGGSVNCEDCDEESAEPCCLRKGHGVWGDYAKAYVFSINSIYNCLNQNPRQLPPHLTAILHSMSGNIDLYARLNPRYQEMLNNDIYTVHFVAPMVNFSLNLKPSYRGWREETIRWALSWITWGLSTIKCKGRYRGKDYMPIGTGPINAFKLQHADVLDKIAPEKAKTFIEVGQQNYKLEIGKATNEWFYQACKACHLIRAITRSHFGNTKVYVHGPGNDQVVYPNWVREYFIGGELVDPANFCTYRGQPHNLLWGTEEGIEMFIANLITLGKEQARENNNLQSIRSPL